jgi:hypothetical protein
MNVPVTPEGGLTFEDGISAAGKYVELRAECNAMPKGQQTPALPAGQFHTSTSAGVGFQPLQGLLSCDVELRAECNAMVLISNCPQLNNPCNGWNPTPAEVP